MDKVKLGIFDVFAYIIPGLFLFVLGIFWFHKHPFCIGLLKNSVAGLNIYSLGLVLIVSYVIGFSIQHFAYQLFKLLLENLAGEKYTKGHETSLAKRGEEIATIRHLSTSSYESLHTFMAMRSMSYSLFFSLLLFSMGMFLLSACTCSWPREAAFVILISGVLACCCLVNAIRFHRMCQELISNTISAIRK